MACAQCAPIAEQALRGEPGVLSAQASYATGRIVVELDQQLADQAALHERLEALGFAPRGEGDVGKHDHAHGPVAALELPLIMTAGSLLALGYLSSRAGWQASFPPVVLYVLAVVAAGMPALGGAFKAVRQRRLDVESLMVIGAAGACVLGAWREAGLLLSLFGLGHVLEERAMARTRRAIQALGKLRPLVARVRQGETWVEVPVGEVAVGTTILVRPGDRVALDGVVKEGHSALDQAAVTGESVPVSRGPGDRVFAGTINTEAALEIEVTRAAGDSTLARVMKLVSEAEAHKGKTQRLTQRIERTFVPLVLAATTVLAIVLIARGVATRAALLRSMAVLVAASPCALAIATPSAVLSAVARAARGGVLIKGGAHIESLGRVASIAFDKTGTLTEGHPRVITVTPAEGVTAEQVLATAAAAEALSAHPLARAITDAARARGLSLESATEMEAVHGKGLRARIGGELVTIGSTALFAAVPPEMSAAASSLEEAGQTTMLVKRGERFLGVVGLADELRPEAKATLEELRELGIARTVMLSGDNTQVAGVIGARVGIDDVRAPLMPDEKVAALKQLAQHGGVAMVGDGVNDAPALAAASVGVAMGGAGSEVAMETADIVLMSDKLSHLPFAVGLARSATRAITQNLVISLGVSAVLVVAAILGWARISEAVIAHEGSTLLVIGNALRLLAYSAKGPSRVA
ncbi:MAG: heavy metal translocating P-type ATPase [Deltaproteobacteria bacterium]|nr:heavy metal translocating P-type ATPase [Deltaproteobacteria bacterium]